MSQELYDLIQHDAYGDVQETLQFLLEECTLDDAPSPKEVVHWQQLLQQRGGKFLKLVTLCQAYLDEQIS